MSDDPRALAARLMQSSRFAIPIDELRTHIAERRARLLAPPPAVEPAFDASPAPMPPLLSPHAFAEAFWASRPLPELPPAPRAKAKKSRALRLVDSRKLSGDNDA
jgi:hypothetical protein